MLPASTGKVAVTGWVDELSPPARGRRKLVIRDVKVPALLPQYVPQRLRFTASGDLLQGVGIGDEVRLDAWLYPLLTPVAPGA